MNLQKTRLYFTIILVFLVSACAPTTATLYHGNMEVVALSGKECSGKIKAGSRIPVELVLESKKSQTGLTTAGYISGPDIYTGHFSGNDNTKLIVTYPQEVDSVAQGHTLNLIPTLDEINGELLEKRQGPVTSCLFDKATFKLKQEVDGNKAAEIFERQQKLFNAKVLYLRGQNLLTVGKPKEAIRELTKCYDLYNEVDRNAVDKAKPAAFIAIAHLMAGRRGEAIEYIRGLFGDKLDNDPNILKLRNSVSYSLCIFISSDGSPKPRIQLLDDLVKEFGTFNGVRDNLVECYRDLGDESSKQDDQLKAIEYYQKALRLNPEDYETIMKIVLAYMTNHNPTESLKLLQKNEQIVIKNEGKAGFDKIMATLYGAEAHEAEISGNLPMAEKLIDKAIMINPKESTFFAEMLRFKRKTGKLAEARKLLVEKKMACSDESCHKEYSEELDRQDLIEMMAKQLE